MLLQFCMKTLAICEGANSNVISYFNLWPPVSKVTKYNIHEYWVLLLSLFLGLHPCGMSTGCDNTRFATRLALSALICLQHGPGLSVPDHPWLMTNPQPCPTK